MAVRKYPIVINETYHVYNRSIADQPIFSKYYEAERFTNLIGYYQYKNPPLRYSFYTRLNVEAKKLAKERLFARNKIIKILAYCIMPTHYHFVLKENFDQGIIKFLSLIQNGYAKYFNLLSHRTGSVFQQRFKAKRLDSDDQLIHTVRYVHLNPYSSFVINDKNQLLNYPYSSFYSYISNKDDGIVNRAEMVNLHGGVDNMMKSTLDQADYQRQLKISEHKMFD